MFTVVDAMRPEYIDESFPGEVNVRMSDILVINKIDQVSREDLEKIEKKLRKPNPKAEIIKRCERGFCRQTRSYIWEESSCDRRLSNSDTWRS